jgi:endonuclease YncB( thermonuclease family)
VSLNRKRRIFRAGSRVTSRRGLSARPTLLFGAIGAVAAATVALVLLPATPFGRVPAGPEVLRADAATVMVVDGATLRLGQRVVRLRGVTAPARGQTCRGSDGASFDCGTAAADALASLMRGHTLTCRMAGRDQEGFLQGNCEAGDDDLGRAQVAAGWAQADGEVGDLQPLQATARTQRRGVWAGDAL